MKCLASTQGPKIRVNAILPGLLLTDWASLVLVVDVDASANGLRACVIPRIEGRQRSMRLP